MRRYFLAGLGVIGWASAALAQTPIRPIILPEVPPAGPVPAQTVPPGQPQPPTSPFPPGSPRPLPPNVPPQAANPGAKPQPPGPAGAAVGQPPKSDVVLPYPEKKVKLDRGSLIVRKAATGWQVWGGSVLVKDFGDDKTAADDAIHAIRDLGPTEWATLGTTRPVVGYAVTDDPTLHTTLPKQAADIDLMSVRAESVRGAWVVRDANGILLNFGPDQKDAEQTAAVVRKYGFNRVGFVGPAGAEPSFSFLYAAPDAVKNQPLPAVQHLAAAHQEATMTRTGVPVPGAGFLGERVVIDAKKIAVRRDGLDYVVAHGSDVIAKFGGNEWSARDAVKTLQEMRVTEFCKVGGQTFFLVNGKAPDRVPFIVQGSRFDPHALVVRPNGGAFGVFESSGRQVFTAPTKVDAENIVRTVQGFGFDQTCQIGLSGPTSLKFLAKVR